MLFWLICSIVVVLVASPFLRGLSMRRAGVRAGAPLASDAAADLEADDRSGSVADALEAAGEIAMDTINAAGLGRNFVVGSAHQRHGDERHRASLEIQDGTAERSFGSYPVAFHIYGDFPPDAEAPQVHVSSEAGTTVSFLGAFSGEDFQADEAFALAQAKAYLATHSDSFSDTVADEQG